MSEGTKDHCPPEQSGSADLPASKSLTKALIAQASFIAALMFYLGAVYSIAYYGHFRISPFTLGYGSAQFILGSLTLLRRGTVVAAIAVLLVFLIRPPVRLPHADRVSSFFSGEVMAAKVLGALLAAAGLAMFVEWRWVQRCPWAAPLTLAAGLFLCRNVRVKERVPEGSQHTAVPAFAAGVCLFWAATLLIQQFGEWDAAARAKDITRLTGILVLSSTRLSIPNAHEEDLGASLHYRYRYTGLRRVVEGQYGYYVVPLSWRARVDPVYLIPRSPDTWVGLTAGVRRKGEQAGAR
ncbi:hypothetical protein [Streptomyces roseoverticillatus]|uniref:Uncharacterized protein n=1 Tax=Streptomyces roseoverticillatus TaxID=66429 RepID=A0ABV3J6D7_9ACTN